MAIEKPVPSVYAKLGVRPVLHDVSFVEATPRYAKKDKLALTIELTDFSVYYSQGAAEAAIAALKEGKSDVLCENGKLIKVSKDKDATVFADALERYSVFYQPTADGRVSALTARATRLQPPALAPERREAVG